MPSSQSNISISTSTAIIGLIVAVLIGIFAFRKCEPTHSPSYPQQQAIDSLTQVIRGLQQQQHKLDGLLVMRLNHIDALSKP